ncbi:TolB family protein [Luteibacter jiangsuensis]
MTPHRITWAMALVLSCSTAGAGELLAPGLVSTGLQETTAAVSPDGATLVFMRSDLAEKDDTLLVSRRRGGQWSTPEVAPFSGEWHDSEPTFSPDGRRLYFVSNRPPHAGNAPLVTEMGGHRFPGTNLWYAERAADGRWGHPVHVEGALNDGAMIYNPTIAANGDVYFSAHRPDSGKFYQIYVSRQTPQGLAPPERVDLGDIARNRMDPAIDPKQRFIVYAGDEGDSLGRADIYIAFREPDGHWGHPEHLAGDVNSEGLENAPSLGPHFGELYVASDRQPAVTFPKKRDDANSLQQRLSGPLNGSRNLWRFDISDVLRRHGLKDEDAAR